MLNNFEESSNRFISVIISRLYLLDFRPPGASGLKHIKNDTPIQVLSCDFWDIFKYTFFTEHLRATASK